MTAHHARGLISLVIHLLIKGKVQRLKQHRTKREGPGQKKIAEIIKPLN